VRVMVRCRALPAAYAAAFATAALVSGGSGASSAVNAATSPSGQSCDRACLNGLIDRYLAALVAHDARRLPLARGVRYTENGQVLELNDGLWGTATALGTYRNEFEDPADGQAVVFVVLHEHNYLDLLSTRLRVKDGRVSEIETIVSRPALTIGSRGADSGPAARGPEGLEKRVRPDPLWSADVPSAERMSRAELLKVANQYFTGMENNDGHGVYPFADDCYRLENGIQTTGNASLRLGGSSDAAGVNYATLGCKAQFQIGFLHVVSRIRDRRFLLVDPERGVVVAYGFFDHNAQLRSYQLTNGRTVANNLNAPITWELAEAFKIEHGLIRRIEAVLTQSPYAMRPNWPETGLGYDPRLGPR
jgi:hypothetical protein